MGAVDEVFDRDLAAALDRGCCAPDVRPVHASRPRPRPDPAHAQGGSGRRPDPPAHGADGAAGHDHQAARRAGRGAHPRLRRRRRPSWATTASPARSAPRSTTRSSTASRAPGCCAEGDLHLDRLRCHRRRLARRRGDLGRSSAAATPAGPRTSTLIDATEDCDVGRHRRPAASGSRCTPWVRRSRTASSPSGERDGRDYGIVEDYVGHGIGTVDAHGPAGAQLPRPRQGPHGAFRCHGAPSSRWSPWARPRRGCSTTTGPS